MPIGILIQNNFATVSNFVIRTKKSQSTKNSNLKHKKVANIKSSAHRDANKKT